MVDTFTLFTLLGFAIMSLGITIAQPQIAPNPAQPQTVKLTEWEYSKLIAEVKKKPSRIAIVTISSDRTYAEVTIAGNSKDPRDQANPQKVRVKLANDPNFIKTLTENKIEIRVAPPRNSSHNP